MTEAPLLGSRSTPLDQILFHVRVIDRWRPPPREQQEQAKFAFFGLELELCGRIRGDSDETERLSLDFTPDEGLKQREKLQAMRGPFELVVKAKMPVEIATEQQKPLLHLFVPVQSQNKLARINKIHFLKYSVTGSDVVSELLRVLEVASIARPIELTFLRHNHTQAAAKIRPFAARADVQQAQIAQFTKLQTDESLWPEERKRKKQFILQQMDFYREHYLYDHIGMQLQLLHEEIMGGGQWHAYEFEKALWYYHAPTGELYAEHPMRNSEKTRQLIGGVQLRTRLAARKLQHGARQFLQLNRKANTASRRLLDLISEEVLASSFDSAAAAPFMRSAVDRLKANTGSKGKAKKLWSKLRKAIPIEAVDSSVVLSPDGKDAESKGEDMANNVDHLQDRTEDEEKLADDAVNELLNVVCDEMLSNSLADAFLEWNNPSIEPHEPLIDTINADEATVSPRSSTPVASDAPPQDELKNPLLSCSKREATPEQELMNSVRKVEIPAETNGDGDDDDEDGELRNWRARLRLLKQHQQERKLSKKNKLSHHSNVVAPRSLEGPMLMDRSSLLLDLALDGPANGLISSLKDRDRDRRQRTDFDDDPGDHSISPSRHRSSSIRFFPTNHESPRLPVPVHRLTASPPLPATRAHATPTTLPPPVASRSEPLASDSALSPPKKLPYIRRRPRR